MTVQQIILLVIFVLVITAAGIYVNRNNARKMTMDKLGRPPLSESEGIAVSTTSGTRAEQDFREPMKEAARDKQAPQ